MDRFKILKILNLTVTVILLVGVSGLAAESSSEMKIEKSNEISKNTKQKDKIQNDDVYKSKKTIRNKQEKSKDRKEEPVKIKKEDILEQEKNEKNTRTADKDVNKNSNQKDLKLSDEKRKKYAEEKKPQILSTESVNIGGIEFKKVITNKEEDALYYAIYKGNLIRFVLKKKREKLEGAGLGSIKFFYDLDEETCEKGIPHFTEHEMFIPMFEYLQKKRGGLSTFMSPIIDKTDDVNALTYIFDGPNNIGTLDLLINKNMMKDEKIANVVFKELLGNPTYRNDGGYLFRREVKNKYKGKITSRALIEMYGKSNKSKYNDGTDSKIAVENWDLINKLKYIPAGDYNGMKEVTMKDIDNFYDKYIYNGFADISYTFHSLEEAKNVISLTKRCYLDKKKKANITSKGKDKFEGDYIKTKVSPEQSVEYGDFKYTVGEEGNKKVKESKYTALVNLEDAELNLFERFCLICLKTDYIQKLLNIKKYGFLKMTNFSNGGSLYLRIWSDNKKALEEENIKSALEDIKNTVIKHVKENGIDFKEDIDKEVLKNRRKVLKKKDYCLSLLSRNILNSYILEKVPFSRKYFKFNKEGQIEDNPKVFEKFLKENCADVVKRIFSRGKIKIGVTEKGKGEYKEEDYKESKLTFLPIMYDLDKKNLYKQRLIRLAIFCSDEVLLKYLENKMIDLGIIYHSLIQTCFLNKYGYGLNDLEIENIRNYFNSGDCKKDYDELVKKLDDKSLDKYLDEVVKKSKEVLDKVCENLENNMTPCKDHIKQLEKLKDKKEITFKDMDNVVEKNKASSDPALDATVFIKLGEEEYKKNEEEKKKERKIILETQKMLENRARRFKEGAKKLDPKSRDEYKEFLGKRIKRLKEMLEKNEKYLKEIKEMKQEIKNNKLDKEDIKHIIKSVKFLKFDQVNSEILKNGEKTENKKNESEKK